MGKVDIGKYLKSKVKGYNKSLDTDEIWRDLGLEKKDKRRKPFWWLFGVMFLLSSSLGVWYYGNQGVSDKNEIASIDQVDKRTPKIAGSNRSVESSNDVEKFKPESDVQTEETANKLISTKVSLGESRDLTSKTVFRETIREASKQFDSNIGTNAQADAPDSNLSRHSLLADFAEIEKESIQNSYPLNSTRAIRATDLSLVKKKEPLLQSKLREQRRLAVVRMPLITAQSLETAKDRQQPEILNDIIELESSGKVENKKRLSLNVYSGVHLVNRNLKSSSPVVDDYLRLRDKYEQALELINLGGGLQYNFPSGLFIEAGLEFSMINEKFEYTREQMDTVYRTDLVLSYLINETLDTTVYETGEGNVELINCKYWLAYNRHTLFHVPLSLGYGIESNRFIAQVKATIKPGFHTSFAGTHIDIDNETISTPQYYRSGIITAVGFSVNVGYRFTDKLAVNLTPSYQSFLTSFIDQGLDFEQRYSSYGLNLGMNWRF